MVFRVAPQKRTGSEQSRKCVVAGASQRIEGWERWRFAITSFGRILLPVDFSERSLDAARQAEVVVRHFHSDVTVLHVVDPDEPEFGRVEPGGVKTHELDTRATVQPCRTAHSRMARFCMARVC